MSSTPSKSPFTVEWVGGGGNGVCVGGGEGVGGKGGFELHAPCTFSS